MRFTRVLAMVLFVVFLASVSLAETASSIGSIDVQKVFKGYKETVKAQEQIDTKQSEFKKEFEKSQEKLQKLQKDGKPVEEIDKMRKDLEEKLEPKRKEILHLNEELTVRLQQKILVAVETVSKKMGVDVVFDKQVIITGGVDLTDMVIRELNK